MGNFARAWGQVCCELIALRRAALSGNTDYTGERLGTALGELIRALGDDWNERDAEAWAIIQYSTMLPWDEL